MEMPGSEQVKDVTNDPTHREAYSRLGAVLLGENEQFSTGAIVYKLKGGTHSAECRSCGAKTEHPFIRGVPSTSLLIHEDDCLVGKIYEAIQRNNRARARRLYNMLPDSLKWKEAA